jgi:hypothetical protein
MTFAELRDDTDGDKSKKANEEAEESEKKHDQNTFTVLCAVVKYE